MKPILLILAFLPLQFSRAEQTNGVTRGSNALVTQATAAQPMEYAKRLLLADGHEGTPVLRMEPLPSPAVRELFPTLTCYRLISSRDPEHSAEISALLISTNGITGHLTSDGEVAFFLGAGNRVATSKEEALRVARAFADLRGYRIVESAPDFPDVRKREEQPAPAETDYKLVVQERGDCWRVFATFLTSEHRGSYERYVLTIWKPPGGSMRLSRPVLIRLRNQG